MAGLEKAWWLPSCEDHMTSILLTLSLWSDTFVGLWKKMKEYLQRKEPTLLLWW